MNTKKIQQIKELNELKKKYYPETIVTIDRFGEKMISMLEGKKNIGMGLLYLNRDIYQIGRDSAYDQCEILLYDRLLGWLYEVIDIIKSEYAETVDGKVTLTPVGMNQNSEKK